MNFTKTSNQSWSLLWYGLSFCLDLVEQHLKFDIFLASQSKKNPLVLNQSLCNMIKYQAHDERAVSNDFVYKLDKPLETNTHALRIGMDLDLFFVRDQ